MEKETKIILILTILSSMAVGYLSYSFGQYEIKHRQAVAPQDVEATR